MTTKLIRKALTAGALMALGLTMGLGGVAQAEPDYYSLAHGTLLKPSSATAAPNRRHTMYSINRPLVSQAKPASFPPGLHPVDVQAAYTMSATGGGSAIAIVDAYHLPNATQDFNVFCTQFGLPRETSTDPTAATNRVLQVVYAQGSQPAPDPGWAGEIALDIEWAHVTAPNAKIYLVEAASNFNSDLYAAVQFAAGLPGVRQVSMSFGGGEFPNDIADNVTFLKNGVSFFASSGDSGGQQSYPAESPNVVGVGGTNLVVSAAGAVVSETAWDNAGGGPSSIQDRPAFQNAIQAIVGTKRGSPDISAVADPRTGAAVYSVYAFGGWAVIGGTSLACPVVSGIASSRGFSKNNSIEENIRNYSKIGSKNFRDITQGSAGTFSAKVGWDFITGCGSPVGLYGTIVNFTPKTVIPYYGVGAVGTVASIVNADFNSYNVSSVKIPPYGITAGLQTTVPLNVADPSLVSDFTLGLTASSTSNNTTIQVYAWDWTKGMWVLVRAFPGRVEIKTYSTVFPAGDFVSGGTVKVIVRGIIPATVPVSSFTLSIDQIKVDGFMQAG